MSYNYNPLISSSFQKVQDNFSNGTIINGISHIYQVTKPTTRPNGDPLVVGDLWYNPSTGIQGFWNGTYWLGRLNISRTTLNDSSSSTRYLGNLPEGSHLATKFIMMQQRFNDYSADVNNYWTLQMSFADTVGAYQTTYFVSKTLNTPTSSGNADYTELDFSSLVVTDGAGNVFDQTTIRLITLKYGSPSNLNRSFTVYSHPIL